MSVLRAVFVDTGAWVALRYGRDQHHAQARTLLRRLHADGLGLVTTESTSGGAAPLPPTPPTGAAHSDSFTPSEWVLAEAVTLLKARGAVDHALALGDALHAGRLGHLVDSTPERRRRAWELFVRYRDRRVGWVDCASFGVMEELGIGQFFGFDDDFARAGFMAYR